MLIDGMDQAIRFNELDGSQEIALQLPDRAKGWVTRNVTSIPYGQMFVTDVDVFAISNNITNVFVLEPPSLLLLRFILGQLLCSPARTHEIPWNIAHVAGLEYPSVELDS